MTIEHLKHITHGKNINPKMTKSQKINPVTKQLEN